MAELIVRPEYTQQYYQCELCGDMQVFAFSVRVGPDQQTAAWADEETWQWVHPFSKCSLTTISVPGKRAKLCNHCWAHRREEAVAKELMA